MILDVLRTPIDWVIANPYLTVAMTVSVALTLITVLINSRKLPKALEGIGPQAVVALGGVAVSVYGLWHFATDLAGLPDLMAIGFIGVFDAAELTLLYMMYREADPKLGWTPELRLMHRTTWMLVCFSAAMNAVHAPTGWAMPVLGAIPPLAAWLIELKLRAKLHQPDADDENAKPGPIRLVILAWQHGWSALFALLGLDAAERGTDIARAAMAQRAALHVYRLRLAIEHLRQIKETNVPLRRWTRSRAESKVASRRRTAQRAIDRADVATDAGQSLAMARRLAALTGVDDLATLTYSDSQSVMDMLETLAVVPSAQRISATTRAMEAEAARQSSEEARERAEAARQEAEDARQRAVEETEGAQEQLEALQVTLAETENEVLQATGRAEAARDAAKRAEAARQEAEDARQRAVDESRAAANRARQLGDDADLSKERLERTEEQLRRVEEQIEAARDGQHGTQDQLAALRRDLNGLQEDKTRAENAYREAADRVRQANETADQKRGELLQLDEALREQATAVKRAEDARLNAEASARRAAEQAEAARVEAEASAQRAAEQIDAHRARAREMSALLERMRGDLADQVTDGPTPGVDGRLYESSAKQLGWERYRAEVSAGRAEPSASDLAERFGVSPGNARNWLRDFRGARGRELAALAPEGEQVDNTPVLV
ncbi:hypothetical protein [Streptomyces xiamenensis]|uniref:hypothetical protein n=1 Tax=Streptomyces xiamenensis TaxID=408015 RepID=UPI0035DB0DD0